MRWERQWNLNCHTTAVQRNIPNMKWSMIQTYSTDSADLQWNKTNRSTGHRRLNFISAYSERRRFLFCCCCHCVCFCFRYSWRVDSKRVSNTFCCCCCCCGCRLFRFIFHDWFGSISEISNSGRWKKTRLWPWMTQIRLGIFWLQRVDWFVLGQSKSHFLALGAEQCAAKCVSSPLHSKWFDAFLNIRIAFVLSRLFPTFLSLSHSLFCSCCCFCRVQLFGKFPSFRFWFSYWCWLCVLTIGYRLMALHSREIRFILSSISPVTSFNAGFQSSAWFGLICQLHDCDFCIYTFISS